jgi:putative membrane protein
MAAERPPALPADLGAVRSVLAADRTLMAWLRTALSMLSFGFTIYKVLESAAKAGALEHSESPQKVGLFLAGMGTAAMVLGLIDYWMTLRDLRRVGDFRLGRPVLYHFPADGGRRRHPVRGDPQAGV